MDGFSIEKKQIGFGINIANNTIKEIPLHEN